MEQLKRIIGLVVGVFCTLVVAWICSYCFKMDLNWFVMLNKPSFLVPNGWFTVFVSVSYISTILAVSRLVEHKHLFPSLLFFLILGICSIFFVWCFFALKQLVAALVFITAVLAMAYVLLVRFLMKDFKMALEFLPAFIFYLYGFLCVLSIALNN